MLHSSHFSVTQPACGLLSTHSLTLSHLFSTGHCIHLTPHIYTHTHADIYTLSLHAKCRCTRHTRHWTHYCIKIHFTFILYSLLFCFEHTVKTLLHYFHKLTLSLSSFFSPSPPLSAPFLSASFFPCPLPFPSPVHGFTCNRSQLTRTGERLLLHEQSIFSLYFFLSPFSLTFSEGNPLLILSPSLFVSPPSHTHIHTHTWTLARSDSLLFSLPLSLRLCFLFILHSLTSSRVLLFTCVLFYCPLSPFYRGSCIWPSAFFTSHSLSLPIPSHTWNGHTFETFFFSRSPLYFREKCDFSPPLLLTFTFLLLKLPPSSSPSPHLLFFTSRSHFTFTLSLSLCFSIPMERREVFFYSFHLSLLS